MNHKKAIVVASLAALVAAGAATARDCNKMVRAQPYAWGAEENIDIELYLAWRGRGLPVETPAVRN